MSDNSFKQVPNVKLRPAVPSLKTKTKLQAAAERTDSEQIEEIDKLKIGGKRPLRRVVISASGIVDKVLAIGPNHYMRYLTFQTFRLRYSDKPRN